MMSLQRQTILGAIFLASFASASVSLGAAPVCRSALLVEKAAASTVGSRARQLVELTDPDRRAEPAAQSLILPTNRFASLEQLDSNLCWSFAFLSSVESTYMAAHPNSPVVLSRGWLQNLHWQERFSRWSKDNIFYMKEGSTADDAFRMLKKYGIVQSKEYKSFATRIEQLIKKKVFDDKGQPRPMTKEEILKLEAGVSEYYFPQALPVQTKFENQDLTPQQLAEKILDGKVWKTYAASTNGKEEIGPHYDPDASPGLKIQYLLREKLQKMLLSALSSQAAAYVSFSGTDWGHGLSLYGVDFNKDGKPIRFYMKDTYPDYFFVADPELVFNNLRAITVPL